MTCSAATIRMRDFATFSHLQDISKIGKMIVSLAWYCYIAVLVPTAIVPRRGLLAPLAAPLPSVFFIELGLRR